MGGYRNMTEAILKIELLSDMCCGSGEGDGIRQDISSTYDENGLPIIYARRIKGILRDKVKWLEDLNHVTKGMTDKVFGTGENTGLVRLNNAVLDNATEIKRELSSLPKDIAYLVTPQAVETAFTVNRYSTAIEKDGIAKDHSFRIVGAIPKGEVFYARVTLDAEKDSEEYKTFEKAVKLLRSMGLNRNRGYGEVVCSLEEVKHSEINLSNYTEKKDIAGLSYVIENKSAIVLKNNYIPGSAIQGWFAGKLNKNGKMQVSELFDKVRFSMAYPTDKNTSNRYLPVPLGVKAKKNEKETCYSFSDGYKAVKDVQYVRVGGFYSLEEGKLSLINTTNRVDAHIRKGDKLLYSTRSIEEGQAFAGRIYCEDESVLKTLVETIGEAGNRINIGASVSAEYSECVIRITGSFTKKELEEDNVCKGGNGKIFEFLSDVILTDEYGFNSVDLELIKAEVARLTGYKFGNEDEVYTDTLEVGGYNSTWGLPKIKYNAFSKGTQLVLKNANIPNTSGFTGLMQSEGYGEYRIRNVSSDLCECSVNSDSAEATTTEPEVSKAIVEKVLLNIAKERCKKLAEDSAGEYLKKHGKGLSSSCAMRYLSAYKAVDNEKEFYNKFDKYVTVNFMGKNNEDILAFVANSLDSFNDILTGKNENLANTRVIKVIEANKNEVFKTYVQSYIFATKMHYREV